MKLQKIYAALAPLPGPVLLITCQLPQQVAELPGCTRH